MAKVVKGGYVIEAFDRHTKTWTYDGICHESLADCLWDSVEEAELVIHDFRSWSSDWATGDYRIVEVYLNDWEAWPGYAVQYVCGEFLGDREEEEGDA